jgi:hypothetical protein
VDGNAIFSGITTATTLRSTTGIVTTLTATGLTVDSGTTNTCATFQSSDAGAVINLTDNSARSSISQNGTDLLIISDTDAGDADSTIKFQVDSSTKAIIDSSGRVLIGTTTEGESSADNLTIADTGNTGITIRSGTSSYGLIYFSDATSGTGEYDGAIEYKHSDNFMVFRTGASERLRIDSSGHMGLGVTPNSNWPSNDDFKALQIGTGACVFGRGSGDDDRAGLAANYYATGSGNAYLANGHANLIYLNDGNIDFYTAAENSSGAGAALTLSQILRMNTSGNLLIGTTSARDIGGLSVQRIHLEGTDGGSSSIGIVNNQNSSGRASLRFGKSRGTSANSNTVVQNGDALGEVVFCGSDGTDMTPVGASIVAEVNGAPGGNDMPGRLVFKATTDGGQSPAERMRIGASGSHAEVFINCTETFTGAMLSLQTNGTTGIGIKAGATNGQRHISFRNPNGEVGSIHTDGSSTVYYTSSDYRLKENATVISDGITRLKTLKPYRFNFKADATTTVDGFFAHEVTAVPEAISGTKDEVDSDNNPVYQEIDHSKLVPLLTAALQESVTEIESLKARLDAAGL